MVRERPASPEKRDPARLPLANISARMQSPNQKSSTSASKDEYPSKPGTDIEFGVASPLRNPLHGSKKQHTNIFVPKARPYQSIRPVNAPRVPSHSDFANDNDAAFPTRDVHLHHTHQPSNPNLNTIYPPPKPIFSSKSTSGFYLPGQKPQPSIRRNREDDSEDEQFDPDAEIQAESRHFGAQDPYAYVESKDANENMKKLLEGAFDDDETKGRTRLRSRVRKVIKEEDGGKNLAGKLARLNVKDEEKESAVDGEEEEEDGTVEGLAVKLLPHQVEGVSWMIDREVSAKKVKGVLPHGGILADDMGLGKTVQSVALLLLNPRPARDAKPEYPKQKLPGNEVGKGTLVVAPLALIKQWESEIKSKVQKDHALKVLVHHGPSRAKSPDQLKKYDVVITTYQTLTSEAKGSNMADGGARLGAMGVHWYRVMLDEAHSIKNRNAEATKACYQLSSWYRWCLTGTPMQNNLDELQSLIQFLRIKPYCELKAWKESIVQPMKQGRGWLAMRRLQVFLKACMKRRTKDILKEEGALNFGGKAKKEGEEEKGGMQIVKREILTVECVLDPHEQEFYDKLQARADKRLQAMEESGKGDYMSALVLLLRLRQACNHPHLVERAIGKDKDAISISVPGRKKAGGDEMDDLAALMGGVNIKAKNCDVCQVQLSSVEAGNGNRCNDCESDLVALKKVQKDVSTNRRAKKIKAKADQRRARTRKVVDDSDEECEQGEWIGKGPKEHVDLGEAGGPEDEDAEGGGETLDTIDSQRSDDDDSDVEDSPLRASRRARPAAKAIAAADSDDEDESDDEEADGCKTDISQAEEAEDGSDNSESEGDGTNISEEDEEDDESSSEADTLEGMAPSGKDHDAPSSKIRHLLRILHKESPEHKTIVFSTFTTMLDLIEPHIKRAGIGYVRYDGSMRPDDRENSLKALRSHPKTRVLLCSLKCGSLGLNLTAASRVVIIEPFWNPFVEEQAIDRVHRLNQTVDVKVYRLKVRNSVEERIIELQEKKRELANAAIEGGKGAGKMTMKDMLGLFRRDAEHGPPTEEDLELWEKFGDDGRLLDGPAFVGATDDVKDLGSGEHRRPNPSQKSRHEHEVYGRRW